MVSRNRAAFRRFLFWFFILPVLAYAAAFALVRSKSYARWSPSEWGSILDFAYEAGHQNADVVIFGDSSAFVGVDPRIVTAQVGVKTVVLPGTIGSLPVTGDIPLQRYLENNPAPRLLVLYFSPWNLDYLQAQNVRLFEGEEMLFRHGRVHEILSFVAHHPVETLVFPFRLYSTFKPAMLRSILQKEDHGRATAEALGHADDPDPFPPFDNSCTLPQRLINARGQDTMLNLIRQHTTSTTEVMVYLSPIPQCANTDLVRDRSYAGLTAKPPAVLPAHDFLADPNYAHIEPAFVPEASRLFAEALRERLSLINSTGSSAQLH